MEQLINKSALVSEIESEIKKLRSNLEICKTENDSKTMNLFIGCYNRVLSLIDALAAKEVDLEHLEQEVEDFCYKFDDRKDKWYDMTPRDKNIMANPTWSNFAMQLAKHFFELGLNAQRKSVSVQNIDDVLKEFGVDPSSKESKILKESYYAALDKLLEQKGE